MKKPIVFLAVITLSTAAFADNMKQDNKSGASMHNDMNKEVTQPEVLENKDIQRVHEEMTSYGLSEKGVEARRMMIGTKEGRAFHRKLAQDKKKLNTPF
tara:strand:- start:2054 stop:2350 length:297 start_codon:yes stop_codon:yes gene_type:complete